MRSLKKVFTALIVVSLIIFNSSYVFATSNEAKVQWEKRYNKSQYYNTDFIVESDEGDFFVGGTKMGYENKTFTAWYGKIDKEGNMLWEEVLTESNKKSFDYGQVTHDGGCILVSGGMFPQVTKVDKDGNILWEKSISSKVIIQSTDTYTETKDGGILISGGGYIIGDGDYLQIIKISKDGEKQWEKSYKYTDAPWVENLIERSNGEYILVGSLNFTPHILRLNSEGDKISEYTKEKETNILPDDINNVVFVKENKDGGYDLICERANLEFEDKEYGYNEYSTKLNLIKLDKDFNVIFNKPILSNDDPGDYFVDKILGTDDGGFIIGYAYGSTNWYGARVMKVNSSSNIEWEKYLVDLSSGDVDEIHSMGTTIKTSDGGYAIAETVEEKAKGDSFENEFRYLRLIKLEGKKEYTSWDEKQINKPNKTWTITFNKELDQSIANKIFVRDKMGQDIQVDIEIKGNKVIVKAPLQGYALGEYELIIESNIKSSKGKALGKGIRMNFKLEN